MKPFFTMLKIEGRLSIRDMNMVIFAIIMPAIVLIILGVIYGQKPAFIGAEYSFLEQSFGALCTISICAGGLMGLPILISEYRERKILKRFQVTPISPALILSVHLFIYVIYSIASLILLLFMAKIFWGFQMRGSILAFLGGFALVMISILSIGILVGGVAKNSKSASVIASVLYFPMLVFSGATLPYEIMPSVMQNIVDIMPLTQGIKILKAAVLGQSYGNVIIPIIIMLTISILCIGGSLKFFRWET
ncbi:MAG: ABC transporter permease [Lachnospiraceae bacterium]|nr:ABC transporter permease [Lachnospiraceae bacterium]